MIKLLLLAVVPFMTQHRNVVPKTEVSTNFYGSVTGIVDNAYIQAHGGGSGGGGIDTNVVEQIANKAVETNKVTISLITSTNELSSSKLDKTDVIVPDIVAGERQAASAKYTAQIIESLWSSIGEATDRINNHDDAIGSKANKAVNAIYGDFAALDYDGSLIDSLVPSSVISHDDTIPDVLVFRFSGSSEYIHFNAAGANFELKYGGDSMSHPWEATVFIPEIGFRTKWLAFTDDFNVQSFDIMLNDATTNQTARASIGAKMMTLIDQPVSQKINNEVTANLNTYIDGATGVEYVGKFYGDSLYYVPTGNVYPPNN